MTTLHVFVGAGGVGKTTLAAGYALALARSGARVGLLGIDPSRRLQDALGLRLGDEPLDVPGAPGLSAAILSPGDALRRWAAEEADETSARRLADNPLFLALADRLATASDVLAAARMVEWAERDPRLDHLVVDTAPGLNAIEFLRRPEQVEAFLEGRLVAVLRWVARRDRGARWATLAAGARRLVAGLARIGGTRLLLDLADLLSQVHRPFERMLRRLERARRWLPSEGARIVLVVSARDEAGAPSAAALGDALRALGMAPWAVVVNRAVPEAMSAELAVVDVGPLPESTAAVVRYARAVARAQGRVIPAVAGLAPRRVALPAEPGLEGATRAEALSRLGARLHAGLGVQPGID